VLFNEPKLLKSSGWQQPRLLRKSFSALQRAEIAEILLYATLKDRLARFSALQRAEIAEM